MKLLMMLGSKYVKFHRGLMLAVLLTFVALGAGGTAIAGFAASSQDAVASSVLAENGGRRYAVQLLNEEAAGRLLAQNQSLQPVQDFDGAVSAGAGRGSAAVRVVRDPLPIGVLAEGAFPRASGEATVSAHLAQTLGIGIGDSVVLSTDSGDRAATVSGIVTKPDDRSFDGVTVVDSTLDPSSADLWLTNARPFSDEALEPALLAGDISARTTAILAEDRAAELGKKLLPGVRHVSRLIVILALVHALLVLTVIRYSARREVTGLTAAGLPPARAGALPAVVGLTVILTGAAVGAGSAVAVLSVWRSEIAHLVGQDWTRVSVPWSSIIVLLLAVGLGAASGMLLPTVARRYRPGYSRTWPVRFWLTGSLGVIGLLLMALPFVDALPVTAAIPGGALVVLSVVGVAVPLSALGTPWATRRVVLTSVTPFALAGACAALISFGGTFYSAYVTHAGISSVRSSPAVQPPGSLLVLNVTTTGAQTLRTEYSRLGGHRAVTYQLPVENQHTLRVSGERLVGCMRESRAELPMDVPDCMPTRTSSPVNTVVLSPALGPDEVHSDPGLAEGGRVGLIDFDRATGKVKSLDTVTTRTDATLGGNMPGTVVAPDGAVAKKYGLVASDAELVALLDFDTLSDRSQAEFRALVTRIATTAQTSERSNERLPEFTVGVWSAAASAGAVFLLWLGLGIVLTAGQSRLRMLYGLAGAQPRNRRALGARLALPPLLSFLASGALGIGAAWVAGVHDGSPFGWWWLLPATVGMASAVVVAVLHGRAPGRS